MKSIGFVNNVFSMKRLVFLLMILVTTSIAGQDVIVHVTAKFQGAAVSSEFVLVENRSNGSSFLSGELPGEVTTYDINLTKGKIQNGINDPAMRAFGFFTYGNQPGQLQIKASLRATVHVGLNFFDLTGRPVYTNSTECPSGVSVITFRPGSIKSGILLVEGGGFKQSFKVTASRDDVPEIFISIESMADPVNDGSLLLKQASYPDEFIFTSGDSVRFTVYHPAIYPGSQDTRPQQGDSVMVAVKRPCPGTPFVTDYDGNVYPTVQIGEQCWMKENLNTTHYANGVALVDGTGVGYLDPDCEIKYWFHYDDNPDMSVIYGRLYTYFAATNGIIGSGQMVIQGVCPAGWHLPTDTEWKTLEMFLGMSPYEADQPEKWRGTDEGGKLKEAGNTHWIPVNMGATNESGFTGLPGGQREFDGAFSFLNGLGVWWTSTFYYQLGELLAPITRKLGNWESTVYRKVFSTKAYGNSVRCLRDSARTQIER